MEQVILVTEKDEEIGIEEKQKAHELALLHRAFSVFIFRNKSQQELLIQQRNPNKYHCGGLWTNTCCSHPRPGESTSDAAHRRLQEEMGFETPLTHQGEFLYKAKFDNGLTEHEYDHVFMGYYDGEIEPNPDEISAIEWVDVDQLKADLAANPSKYTPWFGQALNTI